MLIDDYAMITTIYTQKQIGAAYPYVHIPGWLDPWTYEYIPEEAWMAKH
jgi:hypothetical protein